MRTKLFLLSKTDKAVQFAASVKIGGGQPPRPVNPFWLATSDVKSMTMGLDGVVPMYIVEMSDKVGNEHKLEKIK